VRAGSPAWGLPGVALGMPGGYEIPGKLSTIRSSPAATPAPASLALPVPRRAVPSDHTRLASLARTRVARFLS